MTPAEAKEKLKKVMNQVRSWRTKDMREHLEQGYVIMEELDKMDQTYAQKGLKSRPSEDAKIASIVEQIGKLADDFIDSMRGDWREKAAEMANEHKKTQDEGLEDFKKENEKHLRKLLVALEASFKEMREIAKAQKEELLELMEKLKAINERISEIDSKIDQNNKQLDDLRKGYGELVEKGVEAWGTVVDQFQEKMQQDLGISLTGKHVEALKKCYSEIANDENNPIKSGADLESRFMERVASILVEGEALLSKKDGVDPEKQRDAIKDLLAKVIQERADLQATLLEPGKSREEQEELEKDIASLQAERTRLMQEARDVDRQIRGVKRQNQRSAATAEANTLSPITRLDIEKKIEEQQPKAGNTKSKKETTEPEKDISPPSYEEAQQNSDAQVRAGTGLDNTGSKPKEFIEPPPSYEESQQESGATEGAAIVDIDFDGVEEDSEPEEGVESSPPTPGAQQESGATEEAAIADIDFDGVEEDSEPEEGVESSPPTPGAQQESGATEGAAIADIDFDGVEEDSEPEEGVESHPTSVSVAEDSSANIDPKPETHAPKQEGAVEDQSREKRVSVSGPAPSWLKEAITTALNKEDTPSLENDPYTVVIEKTKKEKNEEPRGGPKL